MASAGAPAPFPQEAREADADDEGSGGTSRSRSRGKLGERLRAHERLRGWRGDSEVGNFLDRVFARWESQGERSKYSKDDLGAALGGLLRWAPFERPYGGTRAERAKLRTFTSGLIASYVTAAKLVIPDRKKPAPGPGDRRKVIIGDDLEKEIAVLKELTWQYVIFEPRMVARAVGQSTIIREICSTVLEYPDLLPRLYAEELDKEKDRAGSPKKRKMPHCTAWSATTLQA